MSELDPFSADDFQRMYVEEQLKQTLGLPPRSRLGRAAAGIGNALAPLAGAAVYSTHPVEMARDAGSYLLDEPPAPPEERPAGAYGGQVNTPGPVHPRNAELDLLEQQYNQKVATEEAARSQQLKQQGFTEFAPGVSYKMGGKPLMGPPEQRTAFGKSYTPVQGGGAASMMQTSGNTPGVRARELERRGQTLEDLGYQQQLQLASLSPQQHAALRQKQDPRMAGLQIGMEALGTKEDYVQQELGALNAQAQARGVQPSPAQMQMAYHNALRKFQADQLELARLAMTSDRPDPYAGSGLPPGQ